MFLLDTITVTRLLVCLHTLTASEIISLKFLCSETEQFLRPTVDSVRIVSQRVSTTARQVREIRSRVTPEGGKKLGYRIVASSKPGKSKSHLRLSELWGGKAPKAFRTARAGWWQSTPGRTLVGHAIPPFCSPTEDIAWMNQLGFFFKIVTLGMPAN